MPRRCTTFPMAKVEDQLVSFLKKKPRRVHRRGHDRRHGSAEVPGRAGGQGGLDEYAGRLKVTESGELLYYFPVGMRSTVHGARARRCAGSGRHSRGELPRSFPSLFKIWIVAMLVGYFVAFVAIVVLAIVASFAASMANSSDSGGGGGPGPRRVRRHVPRHPPVRPDIEDVVLVQSPEGSAPQKKQAGRAGVLQVRLRLRLRRREPQRDWDETERQYVIAYIVSHKGVITVEELMAHDGKGARGGQRPHEPHPAGVRG